MSGQFVPTQWRDKTSTIVVAVLTVIAVIAAAVALLGGPKAPPSTAGTGQKSDATVAASPTPSASPTDAATSGPVASTKGLPPIDPSAPATMDVAGNEVKFDSSIEGPSDLLTPTSKDEVSRLAFRARPGSPGRDTVVIVGALGDGHVFANLPDLAADDTIVITTGNGELTYTVRTTREVAAADVVTSDEFTQKRPGRLLLVGAGYDGDQRGDQDLLVTADLTAAQ